ncbi:MAG: glutathione S-transferase family protein [Alphaproteobacteria bacterium]|nr:glutathione S-transferase family protein [Alphaproteobacteria bacterium]
MIHLHSRATPNGRKVAIALEETGLPYTVHAVDLSKKEQKTPAFLAMNPNGRIPVIVDDDVEGGPVTVFESGAILLYLAEKSGGLLPAGGAARVEALKWLFFGSSQVTHTAMQVHYLLRRKAAGEGHENLAVYAEELGRLYGILDGILADRDFLAGTGYTIADIANWTWVDRHQAHGIDIAPWPRLRDWLARVGQRPATRRGYDVPPRGDS